MLPFFRNRPAQVIKCTSWRRLRHLRKTRIRVFCNGSSIAQNPAQRKDFCRRILKNPCPHMRRRGSFSFVFYKSFAAYKIFCFLINLSCLINLLYLYDENSSLVAYIDHASLYRADNYTNALCCRMDHLASTDINPAVSCVDTYIAGLRI